MSVYNLLGKVNIINGINTNVGKTFFCYSNIKSGYENSKKINYIKPVLSGFDFKNLAENDIGLILKAQGLEPSLQNIQKLTVYLLKAPTSPDIAARIEGITLDYNKIFKFCCTEIENSLVEGREIIIETAGGLCSPLTDTKTMLDLTKALTDKYGKLVKNFLISSNYLGGISHTLSACKLFEFDEIIFNKITQTEFDGEIQATLESFLRRKITPF